MSSSRLTEDLINRFRVYLVHEEKAQATIEKYLRDLRSFADFNVDGELTKEKTLAFKEHLLKENYAVRSINSMIASINSFFKFIGRNDLCLKALKQQKEIYSKAEKELSKAEYQRLLQAAEEKPQLRLIIQTICGTGIRVSELCHFTVEALQKGEVLIHCKGKLRQILIPGKLIKMLLRYAKLQKIKNGPIFINKKREPIGRSQIWAQMKALCQKAAVDSKKVFPHNLHKLFARTFYGIEKDIAKLADILGHSSINTTRIYIMTTGIEHRRKIERLGLV